MACDRLGQFGRSAAPLGAADLGKELAPGARHFNQYIVVKSRLPRA
jgi:hypothetical protein